MTTNWTTTWQPTGTKWPRNITEHNLTKHNLIDTNVSTAEAESSDSESEKKEESQIDTSQALTSTDTPKPDKRRSDIDAFILAIKELLKPYGYQYDGKDDRRYAKNIIDAKTFSSFAEPLNVTWPEYALAIVEASLKDDRADFSWAWKINWPKAIYEHHTKVFNQLLAEKHNPKLRNPNAAILTR